MSPARRPPSRPQRPANGKAGAGRSRLRIIGGQWRSRQVPFPPLEGLRPTPDRVRETLFNWLASDVPVSYCLDLFAGSGALGLEALSREAHHLVFVDTASAVIRTLRENLNTLRCDKAEVVQRDALQFLQQPPAQPFDIVFLDPPFRHGWLAKVIPPLQQPGWLRPGSWVYIEHEAELTTQPWPSQWREHRQKETGQVVYRLFQVTQPVPTP